MTKKQANTKLFELKDQVMQFKKNTKGRAGMLTAIRNAVRFINAYKCEDSIIELIVKEKKRTFDKFVMDTYDK